MVRMSHLPAADPSYRRASRAGTGRRSPFTRATRPPRRRSRRRPGAPPRTRRASRRWSRRRRRARSSDPRRRARAARATRKAPPRFEARAARSRSNWAVVARVRSSACSTGSRSRRARLGGDQGRLVVAALADAIRRRGHGHERVAAGAGARPAARDRGAQRRCEPALAVVLERVERAAGHAGERRAPFQLEQRRRNVRGQPDRDARRRRRAGRRAPAGTRGTAPRPRGRQPAHAAGSARSSARSGHRPEDAAERRQELHRPDDGVGRSSTGLSRFAGDCSALATPSAVSRRVRHSGTIATSRLNAVTHRVGLAIVSATTSSASPETRGDRPNRAARPPPARRGPPGSPRPRTGSRTGSAGASRRRCRPARPRRR